MQAENKKSSGTKNSSNVEFVRKRKLEPVSSQVEPEDIRKGRKALAAATTVQDSRARQQVQFSGGGSQKLRSAGESFGVKFAKQFRSIVGTSARGKVPSSVFQRLCKPYWLCGGRLWQPKSSAIAASFRVPEKGPRFWNRRTSISGKVK